MPRYEYRCKKCDNNFEVVHGIDESVDACSSCGGEVRRIFHPVGIVFKGSGFYATDAKKPGNKPRDPITPEGKDKAAKDKACDNGEKKKDQQKKSEAPATSSN